MEALSRRFRFSLAMLLLCVTFAAIVCGLIVRYGGLITHLGGPSRPPSRYAVQFEGDAAEVAESVFAAAQRYECKPQFDALFASGKTLSDEEREQFKRLRLLIRSVRVNGNSATVSVDVIRYIGDDGWLGGTETWKASKENGAWRLTKTPIR